MLPCYCHLYAGSTTPLMTLYIILYPHNHLKHIEPGGVLSEMAKIFVPPFLMPLGSPGSSSVVWSDLILRGRDLRSLDFKERCPDEERGSLLSARNCKSIHRSISYFGDGEVGQLRSPQPHLRHYQHQRQPQRQQQRRGPRRRRRRRQGQHKREGGRQGRSPPPRPRRRPLSLPFSLSVCPTLRSGAHSLSEYSAAAAASSVVATAAANVSRADPRDGDPTRDSPLSVGTDVGRGRRSRRASLR